MSLCPCGSKLTVTACCAPFIAGTALPETPEALMRSRYTAYTQANIDYIANTMKSPANDDFHPEEARTWAESIEWLRLEILQSKITDQTGLVEFLAYYSHQNKKFILHEISDFRKENGRWYYVDGRQPDKRPQVREATKIARNDACPCGSAKKYKKCCGILNTL